MEHQAVGRVRVELHQKVLRAKVCPACGFNENPWDAELCGRCDEDLTLVESATEDRGMVAASEEVL
jgi:ribosomal protein L40E